MKLIYITAHERHKAIDAYKTKLTGDQIKDIKANNIDWCLEIIDTGCVLTPAYEHDFNIKEDD